MPLHQEPFDGTEETIRSSLVSDEELDAVLRAMEEANSEAAAHEASPYDDWVTVDAICEVTGHNRDEVASILYEHRRSQLASKISERLRELEEPLFRVERPGHHKPDAALPALKVEQINTILDKLMPRPASIKRSRSLETTRGEKLVSGIALAVALAIFIGMLVLIVQAILSR